MWSPRAGIRQPRKSRCLAHHHGSLLRSWAGAAVGLGIGAATSDVNNNVGPALVLGAALSVGGAVVGYELSRDDKKRVTVAPLAAPNTAGASLVGQF
jgi:hypothetical protein